jgi:hypothetical protein
MIASASDNPRKRDPMGTDSRTRAGELGQPQGSVRITPSLSEMSRTALGAMTQRLPRLSVSSASGESLLSHQMSRRLKVRS